MNIHSLPDTRQPNAHEAKYAKSANSEHQSVLAIKGNHTALQKNRPKDKDDFKSQDPLGFNHKHGQLADASTHAKPESSGSTPTQKLFRLGQNTPKTNAKPDNPKAESKPNGNDNGPIGAMPLGIVQNGQHAGDLAYMKQNGNNENIQYAKQLGKDTTGPNGEPMFAFSNGKGGKVFGYEDKDQEGNPQISFTDPVLNSKQQQAKNGQQTQEAKDNMTPQDQRNTIRNHYDQFDGGAIQSVDGMISKDDWKSMASNKDNPKLDATVQDPAERANMRATAQNMEKTIKTGSKMSVSDAMNTARKYQNEFAHAGQGKDISYQKMESVADGTAKLSQNLSPKTQTKIREAAARILYTPLSSQEQKTSLKPGNHVEENKYSLANGGPTLFSELDNINGSTDGDGRFSTRNLNKIKLPS